MGHVQPFDNPRRLGDFEILRELGRGGMGVVYEARQVSLNRKVALKVLSGGLGLTLKAVQRFHREAEAAAKLHHTNIVPVYATGEQDGTHFYAMELIDGPSLDHVIREMRAGASSAGPTPTASGDGSVHSPNLVLTGPYVEGSTASGITAELSSSSLGSDSGYFDRVARTIAEVADALEYAHQQGVIHRDIKPSNLLLSPAGRLSVNDFGLARMLEQPGMTMTGEFVGTPAYMSPEQITAGRTPLDHRTDIYSLGATLYELLTLHLPFSGERRDQVLAMILHKEPKAPRKVNPKVPVDLETICLKAIEKDPDRRYQTAGAMAEDLRRYVNRFAISARRAGSVEHLRKWIKRHPGLAAGVGLALVAICMAGYFASQSWRERQERIAAANSARNKLLSEKKQRAESLIFSGQFTEAETAIGEAVELGVEEDWAQWRRGQIAFHSGEAEKAGALLERAVAKMPENPAANWLLGAAYHTNFSWQRDFPIHQRSDSLTSSTAEDELYRGLFQSFHDPQGGLKILDEGLPRQPALIAHVLRAHVLARVAIESGELSHIERAVKDVTAAKSIQPDNALALSESVFVHHTAAIFHAERKQYVQQDAALAIAAVDAEALKEFPHVSYAVVARCTFLEDQKQIAEAVQSCETAVRQKGVSPAVARKYAWMLFAQGKTREAVEIVERYLPAGYRRDAILIQMIAELSDDEYRRALKLCDGLTGEPREFCMFLRCAMYHYLGRPDLARTALKGFAAEFEQYPPAYADLARGRLGLVNNPDPVFEQQLLERAHRSKRLQVLWHLGIGTVRFGKHDRAGALEHFEKAVAVHEPYQLTYDVTRAYVKRMHNDPTWPPWLEAKNDKPKP